jgi:hypothetical protein
MDVTKTTTNDSIDAQYQQQQLEQLKLETSQVSSDTFNDKTLLDQGISERIVQKLRSCIESGSLNTNDLDSLVCEQLRVFPDNSTSIDTIFDEYNNADLTGVVNKSAFVCNLIKQWKLRNPEQEKISNIHESGSQHESADSSETKSEKHKPGPNESKLQVRIMFIRIVQ